MPGFPDLPPHAHLALWFKPSCQQSALIWEKYWELMQPECWLLSMPQHYTQQSIIHTVLMKLGDLMTSPVHASVLCARPADWPFVSAHGQPPRVLWGKDKAALGGQREPRRTAETVGEGNEEHKAPRASAVMTRQQGNIKPLETMWEGEKERVWQEEEKLRLWRCMRYCIFRF